MTGCRSQGAWRPVYENATCTIAAHSASDDQSGFLSVRQGCIKTLLTFISPQNSSDFAKLVNQSRLSRRGWVFQERILSKRIIHFTHDCIFLEDMTGVLTREGHKLVPPHGYIPFDNKLSMREAGHSAGSWYRLMERYSTCELTYKTDRLPAVAGLARSFAGHGHAGLYMCGLWSESIHHGVLWIENGVEAEKVTDPYRPGHSSPSWSWASWSGPIRYEPHLQGCQPLVTAVLDHPGGDREAGHNAMHYVHRPLLTLCGRLYFMNQVKLERWSVGEAFSSWFAQCQTTRPSSFVCHLDGKHSGQHHYQCLGLLLVAMHETVETFTAATGEDGDSFVTTIHRRFHFLLVVQDEQNRGHLRRVGIGESSHDRWWENCAEMVMHLI